ncbi:MAG: RNA 2',3'-cyclic phosphodiesterase [Deltaproteobacteria bacterium]|nr:RNA 2',3'-cyclic phosphodiesterase [Deltaproteobacteria bacterium]
MKRKEEDEIRSFIALDLSPSNLLGIKRLQEGLKQRSAGVRWLKTESIHLTLKFLGNINEEKVEALCAALGALRESHSFFHLSPSRVGAFPRLDRPRVIWLGVEGDLDALHSLWRDVEAGCFMAGFEKEKRPFSPHLTLGRVKDFKKAAGLDKALEGMGSFAFEPFRIDAVHLYRSELRPEGAHYTKIKSFPLKGGE